MMCTSCPSCGGDLSAVPVTRKLFTQFLMKVVRCPHCRLRTTFLTILENSENGLDATYGRFAHSLSALRDALRK
jgi:hypothetical protein